MQYDNRYSKFYNQIAADGDEVMQVFIFLV